MARIYGSPVNFRAADGSMQPIDDTLVASGAGVANRADSERVFLPHALDAGPIRVSTAGGDVSFALEGAGGSAVSTAGASASYRDVLPGVSVSYTVSAGRLKETLGLADATVPATFRFDLALSGGLTPTLEKSGLTEIRDPKGNVLYTIPTPTMTDGAPSRRLPAAAAGAVAVHLARTARGWVMTLTPDRGYLRASGRRFPVMLDPTLQTAYVGATTDCEIAGGAYANTNYCQYNATGAGAVNPGSAGRSPTTPATSTATSYTSARPPGSTPTCRTASAPRSGSRTRPARSLTRPLYDPYGQLTASTGTAPNPFGYASGLQVAGNLIKYGKRYYDPVIGRWTQQDPSTQIADTGNTYAYASGDPVDLSDPGGLLSIGFSVDVGPAEFGLSADTKGHIAVTFGLGPAVKASGEVRISKSNMSSGFGISVSACAIVCAGVTHQTEFPTYRLGLGAGGGAHYTYTTRVR